MADRSVMVSPADRGWPSVEPEVLATFDDFWADIVCPGGVWDLAQVMRELHDYRTCLSEVPKVYTEITDGLLSKPNTAADAVIAAHDDRCHIYCVDQGDHNDEIERLRAELQEDPPDRLAPPSASIVGRFTGPDGEPGIAYELPAGDQRWGG